MRLRLRDQGAPDDGGRDLTSEAIRERLQLPDGHRLARSEPERTRLDELLEAADRHPIQSAGDFAEARRAIRLEVGAPANQRALREDQVRPREHREEMAAERVIPGRAEGDEHATVWLQHAMHLDQDGRRIAKCSNESIAMQTSAFSSVRVVKTQRSATPACLARPRAKQ